MHKFSSHLTIAGSLTKWAFTVVTCCFLAIFFVWPVGLIVSKAFISPQGFTLDYFYLLMQDTYQLNAISNSLYLAVLTTFFATIVSIPLALINARYEFGGKKILSAALLVPMVMPPFVGAIGLQRFFSRYGAINLFLLENDFITQPIPWLSDQNMFWAVVILGVAHLYPIMYLNLSAAIANIDPSLEEVAASLGVSQLKIHKNITWPLIRPGMFAGAFIVFIWSFTDLGTPLLVGYHQTVPVSIFNMVTSVDANPLGYALVFVSILITVALFIVSKSSLGTKKYEMLARGHVTPITIRPNKITKLLIYTLLLTTIFVALFPHLSVLITSIGDNWFMTPLPEQFTFKYYSMILSQHLPLTGIKNSLTLSVSSTIVDIILGISIAYIVTRNLIPKAQWLDGLVMIPLALPGIIIAFGYVVAFSGTVLDPLDNPVPLLIIAFAIRRLPYMVRAASAGLQQTSQSLEEASLSFGANRLQTIYKITVPLLTANIIAGALLCFSYAMLDVSDSMILAMKDQFYPLTKAIYALYLEQGSGENIASALGVLSIILLSFCIIVASLTLGKRMGELFRSA